MTAHAPVMVAETLAFLMPQRGGVYVDCTVGAGGHSRALLAAGATRLLAIDRDTTALDLAREALAEWRDRVEFVHADYRSLPAVLGARGLSRVDGILADLGVSSMQLDAPGRGFSFQRDEPLDMRMDRTCGPTAAQLLADVDEVELARVIFEYGEERFSRRVARALVRERDREPIVTTSRLASIVRRVVPRSARLRIDPATRTFQALRIWVNRELDGLDAFVASAVAHLQAASRLVVIAFHSLEDRIVKHTLRRLDTMEHLVRVLTKRPLVAGDEELAANPRARSAKLRAAERLGS
ncbi:MAG: 16S rRNA (cytosine(1402)-N(4))-methyltransferase RsmH [Vicinamibacterales bacterium]